MRDAADGTECTVVAFLGQQFLGGGQQFQLKVTTSDLVLHTLHHEMNDLQNLLVAQVMEHNHFVQTVAELGTEQA
jgi:hypothetical protein